MVAATAFRTSLRGLARRSLLLALLAGGACTSGEREEGAPEVAPPAPPATPPPGQASNPLRNAYFGDLHVHTRWSFDAYLFSVRATPDDAYAYARGQAIGHAAGFEFQLGQPLDFQAVTDHGMYLGVMSAMDDPESSLYELELARELRGQTGLGPGQRFQRAIRALGGGELLQLETRDISRTAWQRTVEAAERHYVPGEFTTFVGYEYTTSSDDRGNLHRNVIFRGSNVPPLPFSSVDSRNPEDLWTWLDERRAEGMEALAIPHNSNGSNGHMFRLETFDGEPLDASYAERRMRNEPLVEVTQVKGTSEVHPFLSPNDEWADFELFPFRIATNLASAPEGSYVREAYLNGLKLEESQGFNPFRFGLIGSTDSHNAGGSPEESNYHSKVGVLDATPQRRGSVPLSAPGPNGEAYAQNLFKLWGASGLVGAWAEQNTRESIYDALRRKETFATSGPRMRIRFFAGYDYADDLDSDHEMVAKAYQGGIPMGGDLIAEGDRAPRFLVWATRDPSSAPLQRLQIVKGWVEDREAREQLFDISCSDGLRPDATTHRCPENGAEVDLSDCSYSADLGAAELRTAWSDPTFDASQRAFYYVRVLENPTCRWSTWDAVRAGVEPNPDLPTVIQERAWSSPIWYVPDHSTS